APPPGGRGAPGGGRAAPRPRPGGPPPRAWRPPPPPPGPAPAGPSNMIQPSIPPPSHVGRGIPTFSRFALGFRHAKTAGRGTPRTPSRQTGQGGGGGNEWRVARCVFVTQKPSG